MKETTRNLIDLATKKGFGIGKDTQGFYVWNGTIRYCPLNTKIIKEAMATIEVL